MKLVILIVGLLFILSCNSHSGGPSGTEKVEVNKAVHAMMENIAIDVSQKGPVAWLNYFDSSAHFFMANNGNLAFRDFGSGKRMIMDTLIKMVQSIQLRFSDIRIDSLSWNTASIGAKYHEESKDTEGNSHLYDGYFTGVAVLTDQGWRLRNLHWSE
jgi:hypothetical protein